MGELTHPLLQSSKAKLGHAKAHLTTLENHIMDFLGLPANQPTLVGELDVESGYHRFKVKTLPDYANFKRDVALMIGDVIGNARAALDHAVWHAVKDVTPPLSEDDARRVVYPIRYSDTADLKNLGASKVIEPKIDPRWWKVIEDSQPGNDYPGLDDRAHDAWFGINWGNWPQKPHPLTVLRDLSNDDKHRVITTTTAFARGYGYPVEVLGRIAMRQHVNPDGTVLPLPDVLFFCIDVVDEASFNAHMEAASKPVEVGNEVFCARLVAPAEPYMDEAGHAQVQIFLPDTEDVREAMQRVLRFVELILDSFQAALP